MARQRRQGIARPGLPASAEEPITDVPVGTAVDSASIRIKEINVFDVGCPAHQVVARIGNKWTLLVLYALTQRTKRYTELQKQIVNISPKMLTQVLRNLESDRIVFRKVHPVVPPMVEYSLTPLGASLAKPLAQLCLWANDNYSELTSEWRL